MRKAIYIILTCLIFVSFFAGWKLSRRYQEPVTKEVEVIKNIDRVIYRNYSTMTQDELFDKLIKYDRTPMQIEHEVTELNPEYTALTLKWELYERTGEQELKVPVHQEGNWKMYAGIGVGVVAAGGLFWLLK
jgi:hypothetical protein